jgi:hypothetical protein
MKKFILFFLSITVSRAQADIGCMDKSKHTDTRDGYDYKTLHYVECTCPCHKHRHTARKNKCSQCDHYMNPKIEEFDTSFLYTEPENPLFPPIMPFKYS